MEETGAHRAIDLYDGGDPGGIAGWSQGSELAEMLAKAAGNSSKLAGRFDDVLVIDACSILENQLFDFFFESARFFEVQAYFASLFARPYERTVKRFGGKVGCEEGDGIETECSCGIDCLAQMTVIGFLDGRATGDRHGRVVVADRADTHVDEIVGSAHASNGVVNLRRAIERDDDVVEEEGDLFCSLVQQKTCGEEREMNLPVAKKIAESGEIIVKQRFAACKNDLSNTKVFERYAVMFQILRTHLVSGFALPDVAHDTAAVASTVGVQDEDRQSRKP
jgi:hypothetical protein